MNELRRVAKVETPTTITSFAESPMDQEDIMCAEPTSSSGSDILTSSSYPCKGCGDILEEGKAFVRTASRTGQK